MGIPEGVNTLAGRIATFEGPHHLAKRRASSTKKKTAATASWPHAAPLTEEFARAGFFYKPSATSLDNVMCFLCLKQLDGWEPQDNPALEHATHVPNCGWAINVCIGQRIANDEPVEEDPMDERLVEARRATFADSWPHESKKGWKCKTKKMVEAGWCYDPSPEFDDGVTCFYCNLSLDGWEPKDNPLDEHRKRSPDCLFFALVDEHAAKRRAGTAKGRASRSSKASRLSTQSNVTTLSEAPVFMSVDDLPAEGDDSILTTATAATTTSMTSKGRKTSTKGKPATKRTSKTAQVKKTIVTASSVVVDGSTVEAQVEAEEIVIQVLPKRSARRNTELADIAETNAVEKQPPPHKVTRTRTTKAKANLRVSDLSQDESQLQSELVAAVEISVHGDEDVSQTQRGTKRDSTGAAKLNSSVMLFDEVLHSPEPQPTKPKKGRKTKKAAETEDVPEPRKSDLGQLEEPAPVQRSKAKRVRKGKKAAEEAEPVPEPSQLEAEEVLETQVEVPVVAYMPSPLIPTAPVSPQQQTPILAPTEPSPAPSTPTPAKVAPASAKAGPAAPSSPAPLPKETTPKRSSTPQSSDAENQPPSTRPPSSRPSLHHPPSSNRQTTHTPFATSTPQHSPSKRANIISGGLTSTFPWTAADLETIFIPSPSSKRFLNTPNNIDFGDKEKRELGTLDLGTAPLDEVVRRVRAGLSSHEKKMSVEEWVCFNAARGEERLRTECERLVGVFETQGGRAMLVLEGVECAN